MINCWSFSFRKTSVKMALPRIPCTRWLTTLRKGNKISFDNSHSMTVPSQTKEIKYNPLMPTSTSYSKFSYHCRFINSFSQNNSKPQISSVFTDTIQKCFSSSALYINRTDEGRTPVVNVNLNLTDRLHDVEELVLNVSARKIEMDVHELIEDFKNLIKLGTEKHDLEERKKNISDMMAALSKVKNEDENIRRSREILKPQGKATKESLKSLNKDFNKLEESLMLRSLRLPNILHEETPLGQAVILKEYNSLNDLPADDEKKNHIKIGQELNWLKISDVGPGAFYLIGKLAWLEQDIIRQFSKNMNEIGFLQLNCPEIFRTLVVEGCGIDYSSPDKIYTLQNTALERNPRVEHLSHFVGVSLMSFAVYLTRMELKSKNLPLRYFTIGKSYRPALTDFSVSGLYNAAQTTKSDVCCVCTDKTMADLEFKNLVKMLWDWYSALAVPIRLVLLPASDLQLSEMKKTVIEAWAPSLQKYLQVGSVSSSGVYISERLMITHSKNSSDSETVHLVHAEFLDVSKLSALLLEYGKITDDEFQLPFLPGTKTS